MTSKDLAIKTIQELPDSATWEEDPITVSNRMGRNRRIDKGNSDEEAGQTGLPDGRRQNHAVFRTLSVTVFPPIETVPAMRPVGIDGRVSFGGHPRLRVPDF